MRERERIPLYRLLGYVEDAGEHGLANLAQVALAVKMISKAYSLVKKHRSKTNKRKSRNRKGDPRETKSNWKGT